MNLKSILKAVKLNESTISMIMGAFVIIVVGLVVVNYFRKIEPSGSLPKDSTGAVAVANGEYVVKAGDTLWSISEAQYGDGYKWNEIAKANKINSPYTIEKDQKLVLPKIEKKVETAAASLKDSEYVVVKGDSLWSIAVRAYGDGYKWVEIAKANGLTRPNLIHSGNKLKLPR